MAAVSWPAQATKGNCGTIFGSDREFCSILLSRPWPIADNGARLLLADQTISFLVERARPSVQRRFRYRCRRVHLFERGMPLDPHVRSIVRKEPQGVFPQKWVSRIFSSLTCVRKYHPLELISHTRIPRAAAKSGNLSLKTHGDNPSIDDTQSAGFPDIPETARPQNLGQDFSKCCRCVAALIAGISG
jgi:hypothetical protein